MDEETIKSIAAQLRQPHGEYAIEVGQKMNEGNRHINLNTIEALRLQANDNVLEIGMGNGFFVKNILSVDNSIRYAGCDFSEAMVEESRKHNEGFIRSARAEFHLASAENLPFANETFTKTFTINTVYFWENPPAILTELRRVLKPKGEIIISVRPKSVMEHYPFTKYGFNLFDEDALIDLLSANGFKVLNTLEKDEPDQDIIEEKMKTKTLLIRAEKF